MKNDNPSALDLFSNYSDFMLTDDELLAIHGGATQSGSPGTDSTSAGAESSAPPPPPAAAAAAESALVTHTGHVGTFVGTGAAAGAAVGGTAGGFVGGPAGAAAGAATGGYLGGAGGLVLGIGNEIYEHRETIVDTANGVAEYYATHDVG
jgi:hypothetical protein